MSIALTSRLAAARSGRQDAVPQQQKEAEAPQATSVPAGAAVPVPAPECPRALPGRRAALPRLKAAASPATSPPVPLTPTRRRQSALPQRPQPLAPAPAPEAEVLPSAPASELQKAYGLQPRRRKPKSAPRENTKSGKPRRVRSDKGKVVVKEEDLQVLEWIVLARYVNREQIAEHTGRSAYGTRHLTDRYLRNGWTEQRVLASGRYTIWATKAALALLPHLSINPASRPKPEKALAHYHAVGTLASKIVRKAMGTPLMDGADVRVIYDEQMRRNFGLLTAGAKARSDALTRGDFPEAALMRDPEVDVEMNGHGFLLRDYDRDGVVKSTHRPDLVVLRADGQAYVIGIEVERQAKTVAEYEQILAAYHRSGIYDEVWYVWKDEHPLIEKRVTTAATKLGLTALLRTTAYSDFKFHAELPSVVQTKNGITHAR